MSQRTAQPETSAVDAADEASGSLPAADVEIKRSSALVCCEQHGAQAVISIVERRSLTVQLRYVQWCSLLGIAIDCDERCLHAAGPSEGGRTTPLNRA